MHWEYWRCSQVLKCRVWTRTTKIMLRIALHKSYLWEKSVLQTTCGWFQNVSEMYFMQRKVKSCYRNKYGTYLTTLLSFYSKFGLGTRWIKFLHDISTTCFFLFWIILVQHQSLGKFTFIFTSRTIENNKKWKPRVREFA